MLQSRDNLDILIDTWTYAREHKKAIEAIERISRITDPGPYYLQAATLYLQAGDWQGAVDSAQRSIDSGTSLESRALTIIGMATSTRSYVVNRRWHSRHSRRLRIASPSPLSRESTTLLSWCRQNGHLMIPTPTHCLAAIAAYRRSRRESAGALCGADDASDDSRCR